MTGRSAFALSLAFSLFASPPAGAQSDADRPVEPLLAPERPLTSARQVSASGGAEAGISPERTRLRIHFTGADQRAHLAPAGKGWDLRRADRVAVEIHNPGREPTSAELRLTSKNASTRTVSTAIPPDGTATATIPFAAPMPWDAGAALAGAGNDSPASNAAAFHSDAVSGLTFLSGSESAERTFEVRAVRAVAAPAETPDCLGRRPPVPGDWIPTMREEFDGEGLDNSTWNVHTANYWDERSHFSRANVIVHGGVARLRFERKPGRHNDDPSGDRTPWATGFLDTYGKWTQRYGYFEARVKLPRAPGLWPAFWMMPDRGSASAPRWKRERTTDGGMEFDIMEHLTGWGPHRYHVAFHWNGYEDDHRHVGTSGIYAAHDEEGFLTVGLLWLPDRAVFYCNGRAVARWESDRISRVPSLLRFTHVSGGWDNTPLDDDALPDDFVIDWVRCWQRRDLVEE